MKGFLGTGAPFWSDVALIVEIAMGLALVVGMMLARSGRYRAHKYCQSSVVLLNLVLIATIMVPSFHREVQPQLDNPFGTTYSAIAIGHASLGLIAQLLGLYIILVAGTNLLPQGLRFKRFKPWMRTELTLWWIVILVGIGVYYVWYARSQVPTSTFRPAHAVTVHDFAFSPRTLTLKAGSTVVWQVTEGEHTVTADRGTFDSSSLTAGSRFSLTFRHPGTFLYHCKFHGASGGVGMSGKIVVTP